MEFWRSCSSCKKDIPFSSKYYECSVSTCNGKRTGYVFCSIHCFERHLPGAKHRDAGAIEMVSPTKAQAQAMSSANAFSPASPSSMDSNNSGSNSTLQSPLVTSSTPGGGPTRRIITSSPSSSAMSTSRPPLTEDEILVVVSKLKNYIRDKSEMNTSGDVAEILSHMIRRLCDDAIQNARQDGRKTVMARDFQ